MAPYHVPASVVASGSGLPGAPNSVLTDNIAVPAASNTLVSAANNLKAGCTVKCTSAADVSVGESGGAEFVLSTGQSITFAGVEAIFATSAGAGTVSVAEEFRP